MFAEGFNPTDLLGDSAIGASAIAIVMIFLHYMKGEQKSHEKHMDTVIDRVTTAMDKNSEALGRVLEGQAKILAHVSRQQAD